MMSKAIASEKEISYAEGMEKGLEQGRQQGRKAGIIQSEERLSMLFRKMKTDGRMADYLKGMEDKDYLYTLYEKYDIM